MQDVEAAEAQAAAAHSDDLPQLAIQAGADLNNNVGGLSGPDNAYIAMVRGTYNLFKGGADLAKERETAFLVQESMEVRNKTYREVVRTTRLSWNALVSIEAQMGDLKDHSVSSKSTVGVYRQQFVLGDRTLLDLLDAQNESFNATTAYITGKYTDLFAKYRVLNAEGNLPQCVNVPLPPESDIVVDP
jgi:adhesin transport system outer membrane protein